jgi:Tol biopolymer transport system component
MRRHPVLLPTVLAAGILAASCEPEAETTRTVDFETTEGTQLAFDVSPDGSTIVFDLLGQLWSVPVEGGRAEPLTDAVTDTADDRYPAFSPDGASLVFGAERPGGRGLFILRLEDGSVSRLTDRPYSGQAWAPEGDRIAAVASARISVLDAADGEARQLEIDGMPRPAASQPAWSPDGQRIVFVNAGPGARQGGRLWEVSAEGGTASPVADEDRLARAPVFSPDGRSLAFLSPDSVGDPQVWVMELGGEAVQTTDQEDVTTIRVRWHADGSRLLYHAEGRLWSVSADGGAPTEVPFTAHVRLTRHEPPRSPTRFTPPETERPAKGHMGLALAPGGTRIAMIALGRLWVFDIGGEPRAVTEVPPTAAGLSWSPDEGAVVWSGGPGGAEDLFATDLATGATRQLTALPGAETSPAWSPDGASVAFVHFLKPSLDTPAWDYSDAGHRLRVVPAAGALVTDVDATTDLGEAYTPFGFFQPSQEAPLWNPESSSELLYFQGPMTVVTSLDSSREEGRHDASPTWASWATAESIVYVEDGLLWRAGLDRDSTTLGEATRLSEDAALYATTSRDGSVLYLSPDGLRILRPSGSVEELGWPLSYRTPIPEPLLIRNVRVVPGDGRAPSGLSDILTEGGRILRIDPSGTEEAPEGTSVADAGGRTAIPGLIDLHTHLWDDGVLPSELFYGVTTHRDMGSTGIARLAGHRDAIEAGVWQGPRLVLGGVQLWGTGRISGSGGYQAGSDSARARALALLEAFGSSYLKMRLFQDWPAATRLVAAARDRGWSTSGHVALPLPMVAAGVSGMEHLGPSGVRTDQIVYDDVTRLFHEAGMWVVPTVAAYASVVDLIDQPGLLDGPDVIATPFLRWWAERLSPGAKASYTRFAEVSRRSAGKLHEAGVPLGAGADAPGLPWAVQAELEELVSAGLTPLEALSTATGTAAEILGASEEIGTLQEGRWADLVILDGDPLEDIRNTRDIWMVIKGGVPVDRDALRTWTTSGLPSIRPPS